ncbi:MAG: hypothetical protein POH28_02595 [Acidocella sp.]|nr:hypothetical protein [Acidocella sp.]
MNILPEIFSADSPQMAGFGLNQPGMVHELRAAPGSIANAAFAVAMLKNLAGTAPVLWVSSNADWYPPGLAWSGLDPARCLFAQARDDTHSLGLLEQALRGGLAGVAQADALSRLAARRLAFAARHGAGVGFLLRAAPRRTALDSTAPRTRWFITPAPGARLRAELLYAKGAQPATFMFEMEPDDDHAAASVIPVVARAG